MKKILFLMVTACVLALGAIPASAQYQPMFITVSPTAVTSCGTDTGQVTIDAGYFRPGSDVVVTLQSDPVTLGTAVANSTGVINATYNLPVGVVAGPHTVIATGARLDTGVTDSVSAAITVTIPAGCVADQNLTSTRPSPGGVASSGQLPTTGNNSQYIVMAAAALLVAGGLIVLATRKRNAAAS